MHGFGFTNGGIMGWGIMLAGVFLFILMLVGLAVVIGWALRQRGASDQSGGSRQRHAAEDILKARYARGEITREQYLSMLEDLNQ